MSVLALKVVLTPTLIGLASLAGRRWGHAVSGWIVALPLTTGPIVLFLALAHGTAFAAATAVGILSGGFSLAAFCIVYARLAQYWTWLPTLATASSAFLLMTAILRSVELPLALLWLAVLAALLIAIELLPRAPRSDGVAPELPGRWDLPLRMAIATAFVILITGLAPALGPHLAGLLSPFPIFSAILAAFAQNRHGAGAAISILRGLLLGLLSYASFMFALAMLLVPAGIHGAFTIAILVVVIFQAVTLRLLNRGID